MKKSLTRFFSIALATTMFVSSVPATQNYSGIAPLAVQTMAAASEISITDAKGWQEAAWIEWQPQSKENVAKYVVSYSKDGANFNTIDDELIRVYRDGHWRADIIGVAAGSYTVKVEAIGTDASVVASETSVVEVVSNDRTGFTFSPKSARYDNGGCGAYNVDGTLKSDANVLYITEENFDSVTLNLKDKAGKDYTATGLADICKTMGAAAGAGYKNPPLAVRFIGTIKDEHTDLASPSLLETKADKEIPFLNITFEGVGKDTLFYGLGLRLNGVANCEIRNIAFYNWHDDAIQLQGNGNSNHWIHNNDLFYGENHGGDQKKGDGATDVKDDSQYITYSYNHYWDSGKTSLCGMKSESGDNYITYHHNWFDHSDSRHPRIRTMFVHVYNNYYDGNAKYGVGAALNSSAFVEGNYFRNCKHPMLSSKQGSDIMANQKTGAPDFSAKGTFSGENGGIIKAYNNFIIGSDKNELSGGVEPVYYDATATETNGAATQFDAYLAKSRDEQIPSSVKALAGGKTFDNSNVDSYILSIPVQEPEAAKALVEKYAGRTGGNDFTQATGFAFNNSVDDVDYELNNTLVTALTNYSNKTNVSSYNIIEKIGGTVSSFIVVPPTPTESTTETTTSSTDSTETTTVSTETSTETTTSNLEKVSMAEPVVASSPDGTAANGENTVIYRAATDDYLIHDTSSTTATVWENTFVPQTAGKVVIRGKVTPTKASGKWAFVQIRGKDKDGKAGEIVALASDDKKMVALRSGGSTYTSSTNAIVANSAYEYEFAIDMDAQKVVLTVNGNSLEASINASEISSVYMITAVSDTERDLIATMPFVGVVGGNVKPARMWGDFTNDNKLSSDDSAFILQYVLNSASVECDAETLKVIDVNGDGSVLANDSALVLQKVLLGTFKFPVE